MPRYKRTAIEAELDVPAEPAMPEESRETLTALRNMWEFASLMQYIFLFGHVVKIDEDFDIEDLEAECLKPTPSEKLARIGLQLLKYVSSHRGLTPEIFDEYTRRQYLAKAPQRNPFGDEEDPVNFNDLDIYIRIRVLQQLSTWTLGNAERIRGMMPQDEDHTSWRMEPLGWDKEDRAYYVLDDNRLYRRSDEPLPPPIPQVKPKSKAKSKPKKPAPRKGTRTSKRRKIEDSEEDEQDEQAEADETAVDETEMTNGDMEIDEEEPGFGFTSKTWECIAVTHEEYQDFMASIFRSRDANEKLLRQRLEEDVLPIIEKRAEAQRQKQLKKIRELENLQKMATAKRSSRLADKADKEAKEREEREVEERRQADLKMAREEQERQKRIEEGHESRRLTREQRVREREAKRILHEEELAKLEQEGERAESQGVEDQDDTAEAKRASGRQRQNQKEQLKQQLEKLAEEDGTWYFDCSVCGQHGENMDDGSHSIACDRCNVWQHSKCHGFSPKQAEQDGFTFICGTCKRKEEDAKKPKLPPLKLHNRPSASPESQKNTSRPATANGQQSNGLPPHLARQLDGAPAAHHFAGPSPSPGPFGQITNGPSFPPDQAPASGYRYPPVANFAPHPHPPHQYQGSPQPPQAYQQSPPVAANGYPQHQQQHQYAHQHAVAAAGGHPPHHQQYTGPPQFQQVNGYHPAYSPQQYAPQQYAPQQYQHPPQQSWPQYPPQQQPPPRYQQNPHYPPQPPQRQGSSQLANGVQSPSKAAAPKPAASSSPPQQPPARPSSTPQQIHQSPKTSLPPPQQQPPPAQSPIKSSPAPAQQPAPAYQQSPAPLYPRPSPTHNPPQLAQTPQHGSQLSAANGHHKDQLQSPHMQPPSASPNATHVAADGMSGPWPEGSKAIPQKHDQSPAPSAVEKTVLPPMTPLVPSPSQQAAAAAGAIPVKKMQSPAQAQAAPGSSVEHPAQQQ